MLKNAIVIFILAIIILILFIPTFSRMQDKKEKIAEYDKQIEVLANKNIELMRERKLLEEDPVYLEKVAREKLGIVREGEVIYRVNSPE